MSWLSILSLAEHWLPVVAKVLPAVAQGVVAVLHASGADEHRTIAGDVAKALQDAGDAAEKLHKFLSNGAVPGAPQTPGTVNP